MNGLLPQRAVLGAVALATLALGASAPAASAAPAYVPGEVIVKYHDGTSAKAQASVARAAETGGAVGPPATPRKLDVKAGVSVARTVDKLRSDPRVEYATPNYVAHASGLTPNDPGFPLQWNLSGPRESTCPTPGTSPGRGRPRAGAA